MAGCRSAKLLDPNSKSGYLAASLALEQQHRACSSSRTQMSQAGSIEQCTKRLLGPFSTARCHYEHLEVCHEGLDADVGLTTFGYAAFNDYQFGSAPHLASARIENCDCAIVVPIVQNLLEQIDISGARDAFEEASGLDLAAVTNPGCAQDLRRAPHDGRQIEQDAPRRRVGLQDRDRKSVV